MAGTDVTPDAGASLQLQGSRRGSTVHLGVAPDGRVQSTMDICDAESPVKSRSWCCSAQTRKCINDIFDNPTESSHPRLAVGVSSFYLLLILASTAAFMAETVPEMSGDEEYGDPDWDGIEKFWFWLETVFVAFFTVEYVLRFSTDPRPRAFPLQPANVVDLAAILPYYIELAMSGGANIRFIRVIRLARVFRVLKLGKSFQGTEVLVTCISNSKSALTVPFFMVMVADVVFASLINLVEQGDWEETCTDGVCEGSFWVTDTATGARVQSEFVSVPESMWWALVTMTTVGYGDHSPNTALGKVVAVVCMLVGVLFMAMPIAVIGNNFVLAWNECKEREAAASQPTSQVCPSEDADAVPPAPPVAPPPARATAQSPRPSSDPLLGIAVSIDEIPVDREPHSMWVSSCVESHGGKNLGVVRLHGACRCAQLSAAIPGLRWHCDRSAQTCATAIVGSAPAGSPRRSVSGLSTGLASPAVYAPVPFGAKLSPRGTSRSKEPRQEGPPTALCNRASAIAARVVEELTAGEGFVVDGVSMSGSGGSHRYVAYLRVKRAAAQV
eukprot:TRINITY_DN32327_c0_g1_i1.p1 TRINITY_DN32327_c0_g1~~TRINITY_DN32327_c0_g1_i1.p1  ORF type:complete len:556 (+),score=106.45 TRINITY_DN32327_c0_g1_i1:52-1719(+)